MSEFFSSEEIGEETDKCLLSHTMGSQNKYQALPLKVVNRKRPLRDDWSSFNIPQRRTESNPEEEAFCIKVSSGFFTWTPDGAPALSNIDIRIPRGQLTMIVGQVGCGKSSLLLAALGEMHRISGDICWNSGGGGADSEGTEDMSIERDAALDLEIR
ncbi:hypothetical protein GDO81_018706 [Engystomops pustulosus]|uniref:ABC transporter domain-containing protein n=1 Tax=Engystomops pustulosus TaxID=76066 RepID=A0AAV6YAY6_ENGPU|nr:hypothetical protein GDO81_018706 [Engystomops pustulosus]